LKGTKKEKAVSESSPKNWFGKKESDADIEMPIISLSNETPKPTSLWTKLSSKKILLKKQESRESFLDKTSEIESETENHVSKSSWRTIEQSGKRTTSYRGELKPLLGLSKEADYQWEYADNGEWVRYDDNSQKEIEKTHQAGQHEVALKQGVFGSEDSVVYIKNDSYMYQKSTSGHREVRRITPGRRSATKPETTLEEESGSVEDDEVSELRPLPSPHFSTLFERANTDPKVMIARRPHGRSPSTDRPLMVTRTRSPVKNNNSPNLGRSSTVNETTEELEREEETEKEREGEEKEIEKDQIEKDQI